MKNLNNSSVIFRTSNYLCCVFLSDLVHADGFYFFDIHIHRTLVLVELEEDGVATIIWAGTHLEYETIFRNNKSTIEKWLRKNKYIK